jgi:hypothetical protein
MHVRACVVHVSMGVPGRQWACLLSNARRVHRSALWSLLRACDRVLCSTALRYGRYFVATNQANSYAVYYFEREEQSDRPSKRKGEIFMSGYSVRSVKREEEIRELGEHALVLEVCTPRCVCVCMCSQAWVYLRVVCLSVSSLSAAASRHHCGGGMCGVVNCRQGIDGGRGICAVTANGTGRTGKQYSRYGSSPPRPSRP